MIDFGGWSAYFDKFNLRGKIEEILSKLENEEYYPSKENIFRAIQEVSPENVKVVIVGQDPYHIMKMVKPMDLRLQLTKGYGHHLH